MNKAERWCSPNAKLSNKSLNCQLQDDDVITLNVSSSKFIWINKFDFRTEEQKRKDEDENDKYNINYKHKAYAAGLDVNDYNRKSLMCETETKTLPEHPPPILVDNVHSVLKPNHF